MKITWYGHAAFGIEGANAAGENVKVILDPYNHPGCGGYLPIDEAADIVCVSHENPRYHSDLSSIRGEPEVLRGLEFTGGERTAGGVRFESVEVYENDRGEGPNAIVKFLLDDITVAHQGDLGHPPEGTALDFFRGVDILLALAGGPPTIALDDLVRLIDTTRPPLVFPMHYKTPKVNLDILPVEAFLERAAPLAMVRPGESEYEVSRESLPRETTIVVLDHAR